MKGKVWAWEASEGTHSRGRSLSTVCITGTHISMSSRSQIIYLQCHKTGESGDKEQALVIHRGGTIKTQITVSSKRVKNGIPKPCTWLPAYKSPGEVKGTWQLASLALQGIAKDVTAGHKCCRTQWLAGHLNTHFCPGV